MMWNIWYQSNRISDSEYLYILNAGCVRYCSSNLEYTRTKQNNKKKNIKILGFKRHFDDGKQRSGRENKHNKRILKVKEPWEKKSWVEHTGGGMVNFEYGN